ncbi:hypothetical protein P872_03680 [Rhodonellum psychrophilum GCM71 = DSM 17998]|uniref:Uncharacterized protein n=1 Tax=Rhodonellum psychrophilum GCM71 = DSM 17998 TaxID=1123057 RepID=U5BW13_9BACT|nr:hypothetical protein P872_03680 [Rhodonellum psychrophilum GCM71 = DSM 17998]
MVWIEAFGMIVLTANLDVGVQDGHMKNDLGIFSVM